MNLTAVQTGAGWDVDETTGGSPVIALDGSGRPIGLKDPTSGQSVFGDSLLTVPVLTPNVIRLNCVYPDSADRVLVDIDSVHSWSIACVIGQATTVAAGKECVAALNSARMWLDSCPVLDGSNPKFASDSTSIMRHYESGYVVNTAGYTGTVRAYLG